MHYVIRWFRLQWNNVIAPLITDAVITGSVGDSTSQTKVASTALYVLMQRSIVPGCPLTEHGRNLVTNFIEYNKKCGRRVCPPPASNDRYSIGSRDLATLTFVLGGHGACG